VKVSVAKQEQSEDRVDRPTTSSRPSRHRRKIDGSVLFQGDQELVIVHGGEEYLLRITRNGKLILTK